ncbi:MAG TPA: hypothetical protein VFA55_02190 [Candidatus Kapabacteria bacterium]|nr:hypothetical protein [Candidatus Kapabacteria bacterium]
MKMRRILFASCGIAIACALWSCRNNSGATGPVLQNSSSSYYPLTVGDFWEYNVYSDSDGVIVLGSKRTDIIVITDTAEVNGTLAYAMHDLGDGLGLRNLFTATSTPISYLATDLKGNLMVLADTSFGTQLAGIWNIVEMLSNHIKGMPDSYALYSNSNFQPPPFSPLVNNYIGDSSVSVPAGKFNAITYKDSSGIADTNASTDPPTIEFTSDVRQSYYAPGVGLVKFIDLEIDSSNASGQAGAASTIGVYAELVCYSVK